MGRGLVDVGCSFTPQSALIISAPISENRSISGSSVMTTTKLPKVISNPLNQEATHHALITFKNYTSPPAARVQHKSSQLGKGPYFLFIIELVALTTI